MNDHDDSAPKRLGRDAKRTAIRREKQTAETLTAALFAAPTQVINQVELDPQLRDALRELHAAFGKRERPRLLLWVTKLVRESDMDAIAKSLAHSTETGGSDPVTRLAERWRDRLCAEGDPVLSELFEDFPNADRTLLRQTVMKAQKATGQNAPRARREVLLRVRELLREGSSGATDGIDMGATDATDHGHDTGADAGSMGDSPSDLGSDD